MILVDTSVWIDHLRRGNRRLQDLLNEELVYSHSFVIGELACGNLSARNEILNLLETLPKAQPVEHFEVLDMVNTRGLYGMGLGWIDMHLLASALMTECSLWTLDKRLVNASLLLNISA